MEIKKRKEKKARLAGLKSCSVSAGNTKRHGLEKLLYTGQNVVWAFHGNGNVA